MARLQALNSYRPILNPLVLDKLDVPIAVLNNLSIGRVSDQRDEVGVDVVLVVNRDVDGLAFEDVDDHGVAAEFALGLRSPDLGEVAVDALDLSVDDDDVFEFAQVDLSVLVGFLLDAFL